MTLRPAGPFGPLRSIPSSAGPRPAASTAPPAALAATLARAADALAGTLLLLDGQARLLHANAAGLALLARQRWLMLDSQARVTALQPAARRAFATAMAAAAEGERQLLPTPASLGMGWAVLSPLSGPDADRGGRGGKVLLMLPPGAGGDSTPVELASYARLHGLSGEQLRLLECAARGDGAAAAARALGLPVGTARRQLAALLRQTGHHSRAELQRSLLRLPPVRAPAAERDG
jgi:DNA-binding CsgD family transcriptional regulator